MPDTRLDAFPEEHDAAEPRSMLPKPHPAAEETTDIERLVITTSQVTAAWETLPTEDEQIARPDEQSITPAPVAYRRPFVPTASVVAVAIAVVAAGAVVKRLGVPSEARRNVAVQSHISNATPVTPRPLNIAPAASDTAGTGGAAGTATTGQSAADVASTPERPPASSRANRIEPRRQTAAAVPRSSARERTVAEQPRIAEPVVAVPPPPVASAVAAASPVTPAAAPVTEPAAPATTAPATVPSSPPSVPAAAAAPTLAPETRAVLGTLYRYQEAFSTLDSNAAHQVWPRVDVRALDRAFEQLEEQTFDLQACEVGVAGERAEAMCTGTATYARKVGNRAVRVEPRKWRFTLQQHGGEWLIQRVDVR
jgi:hypothetical protein